MRPGGERETTVSCHLRAVCVCVCVRERVCVRVSVCGTRVLNGFPLVMPSRVLCKSHNWP